MKVVVPFSKLEYRKKDKVQVSADKRGMRLIFNPSLHGANSSLPRIIHSELNQIYLYIYHSLISS